MLNILIYDPLPISLYGLERIIGENIEGSKITSTKNVEESISSITKEEFALAFLSIWSFNIDEVIEILKSAPKNLCIGLYYEEFPIALQLKSKSANINGLFSKKLDEDSLVQSIKRLILGKQILCSVTQGYLLDQLFLGKSKEQKTRRKKTNDNDPNQISPREQEVLNLLVKGLRTSEISKQLNLRMSTVSTMKATILRKEDVKNVIELIAKRKANGQDTLF